jgi:hypothetical protein
MLKLASSVGCCRGGALSVVRNQYVVAERSASVMIQTFPFPGSP